MREARAIASQSCGPWSFCLQAHSLFSKKVPDFFHASLVLAYLLSLKMTFPAESEAGLPLHRRGEAAAIAPLTDLQVHGTHFLHKQTAACSGKSKTQTRGGKTSTKIESSWKGKEIFSEYKINLDERGSQTSRQACQPFLNFPSTQRVIPGGEWNQEEATRSDVQHLLKRVEALLSAEAVSQMQRLRCSMTTRLGCVEIRGTPSKA